MKILHLCLAAPFTDGMAYQENILPYWHQRLGHSVSVIASTEVVDKNNLGLGHAKVGRSVSQDGIPVERLPYAFGLNGFLARKLRIYRGLKDALHRVKPDYIFIHDLQFYNTNDVVQYCQHYPSTRVVVDCHADFSNSARSFLSYFVLHRLYYRWRGLKLLLVCKHFWGVLPSRCDFLSNVYDIPSEKVKLLEMGFDDRDGHPKDLHPPKKTYQIQNKVPIQLATGGKIDSFKSDTINFMREVSGDPRFELSVFGSVSKNIQNSFVDILKKSPNIRYLGWLDLDGVTDVLKYTDVAVFAGRHSVLWEQSVGLQIPLVLPFGENCSHIDFPGNVLWANFKSSLGCKKMLDKLADPKTISSLKKAALSVESERFLYSNISKKTLEI